MLLELGGLIIGLAAIARLASRLSIPATPLYLLAGLMFGRGGLLPLITTEEFVSVGAEIGLILVLFMLGLEHPARELVDEMRASSRSGFADLGLNFTPGVIAGLLLGWGWEAAAFLGVATYVTSSGVSGRLLQDLRAPKEVSRPVVSLLVLEDLAMALLLPVLGVLVASGGTSHGLITAAGAVLAVILILMVALRYDAGLSRLLFSRSDETLLLTMLGFGFLLAGVAERFEVSAAIGALMAGVLLSGPTAREARPLLAPLRDLFAAFFFAFIGFSVDPATLAPVLVPAVILAVVTGLTKMLTGYLAAGRSTGSLEQRVLVGGVLIARGEFSLAVAGLAVAAGLDPSPAPLIVAYVVILAVTGPLVARLAYPARRHPRGDEPAGAGRAEGSG